MNTADEESTPSHNHFYSLPLRLVPVPAKNRNLNFFKEEVLSEVANDAHVIMRGTVVADRIVRFFNGKKVSLTAGRKLNSEQSGTFFAETTATVRIASVLKGPVAGETATFR